MHNQHNPSQMPKTVDEAADRLIADLSIMDQEILSKMDNDEFDRFNEAVAASILLVTTISIVWRVLASPEEPEPEFAEIERRIVESGYAARLLAATELLSKYPEADTIVKQQYRHIVEEYSETPAAEKAKLKMQ